MITQNTLTLSGFRKKSIGITRVWRPGTQNTLTLCEAVDATEERTEHPALRQVVHEVNPRAGHRHHQVRHLVGETKGQSPHLVEK